MPSAPQPVPISSTVLPGADAGEVEDAVDLAPLGARESRGRRRASNQADE